MTGRRRRPGQEPAGRAGGGGPEVESGTMQHRGAVEFKRDLDLEFKRFLLEPRNLKSL